MATVIALDWPPELRDKTKLLKIDTTHLITSQRNKVEGGYRGNTINRLPQL